jgi:membrane-bound lytic murein transglycosylase B
MKNHFNFKLIQVIFLFFLLAINNVVCSKENKNSKNEKADITVPLLENEDLQKIVNTITQNKRWTKKNLLQIFSKVQVKESILKIFARTPEGSMTWDKYRKIFITDDKVEKGAKFYQRNYNTLKKAERKYGVPSEIITAILGVETRYGANMGSHRVIDALTTLALFHPQRTKFFTRELIAYFQLVKKENLPIFNTYGSYAGAMGLGQFMPTSYQEYAVDFDNDGVANIISNKKDAIGSIANYLKRHKWQTNKRVTLKLDKKIEKKYLSIKSGKPKLGVEKLKKAGVDTKRLQLKKNEKYAIHPFDKVGRDDEYWLSFYNFYVITRYNNSIRYAMAVFQLSQEIKQKWQEMKKNKKF